MMVTEGPMQIALRKCGKPQFSVYVLKCNLKIVRMKITSANLTLGSR